MPVLSPVASKFPRPSTVGHNLEPGLLLAPGVHSVSRAPRSAMWVECGGSVDLWLELEALLTLGSLRAEELRGEETWVWPGSSGCFSQGSGQEDDPSRLHPGCQVHTAILPG